MCLRNLQPLTGVEGKWRSMISRWLSEKGVVYRAVIPRYLHMVLQH